MASGHRAVASRQPSLPRQLGEHSHGGKENQRRPFLITPALPRRGLVLLAPEQDLLHALPSGFVAASGSQVLGTRPVDLYRPPRDEQPQASELVAFAVTTPVGAANLSASGAFHLARLLLQEVLSVIVFVLLRPSRVFRSISEVRPNAYPAAPRGLEGVSLELKTLEGHVVGPHAPNAGRGCYPPALEGDGCECRGHQDGDGHATERPGLQAARGRRDSHGWQRLHAD
mmetsp:Transcript_30410/g.56834  ORF Transcript_30410/g.56834 Transcript_30410/m.56834 type:complete len:228 (-) Transcript_30410:25-708(-)